MVSGWETQSILRVVGSNSNKEVIQSGPNFIALLTAEFCACDNYSPPTVQARNFSASCVSEEIIVTWSFHAHKQKLSANP